MEVNQGQAGNNIVVSKEDPYRLQSVGTLRDRLMELGSRLKAWKRVMNGVYWTSNEKKKERGDLIYQVEVYEIRVKLALIRTVSELWWNVNSSLFEKCFIEMSRWSAVIMDVVVVMGMTRLLDWMIGCEWGMVLQVLSSPIIAGGLFLVRKSYNYWGMSIVAWRLEQQFAVEMANQQGDEAKLAYLQREVNKLVQEAKEIWTTAKVGETLNQIISYEDSVADRNILCDYVSLNKDISSSLENNDFGGWNYNIVYKDYRRWMKADLMERSGRWSGEKLCWTRAVVLLSLVGINQYQEVIYKVVMEILKEAVGGGFLVWTALLVIILAQGIFRECILGRW